MRAVVMALVMLATPAAALAGEPDVDFSDDVDDEPMEVIVARDPTPLEHESLVPDRFEYKWQRDVWALLEALRAKTSQTARRR